jgi:hypothetical protein
VPVPHTYNPNHLRDWGQEDWSLRPTQADSCWDPNSKIIWSKWTGGMAWTIECLVSKHEALSSNSSPTKINKYINKQESAISWINEKSIPWINIKLILHVCFKNLWDRYDYLDFNIIFHYTYWHVTWNPKKCVQFLCQFK